jgi:hypothetical protein
MMRSKIFLAAAAAFLASAAALMATNQASAQQYAQAGQACTLEYLPVCGLRSGRTKTYPNACVARSDGARIIAKGKCRHRGVVVRG